MNILSLRVLSINCDAFVNFFSFFLRILSLPLITSATCRSCTIKRVITSDMYNIIRDVQIWKITCTVSLGVRWYISNIFFRILWLHFNIIIHIFLSTFYLDLKNHKIIFVLGKFALTSPVFLSETSRLNLLAQLVIVLYDIVQIPLNSEGFFLLYFASNFWILLGGFSLPVCTRMPIKTACSI